MRKYILLSLVVMLMLLGCKREEENITMTFNLERDYEVIKELVGETADIGNITEIKVIWHGGESKFRVTERVFNC